MKQRSLEELWQLYPILLKEYNPDYPSWYEEEKRLLCSLLNGCGISRMNHIGSTSVEGLAAKPTIDILLEFPGGYDIGRVSRLLQGGDWILMQKNEEQETLDLGKGYLPEGFAQKVYHLHIKPLGDWNELYFRDYLRQYPEVARQYEVLKLRLKERFEHNRDAYTQAKTDFVLKYSQKAKAQFAGRYRP